MKNAMKKLMAFALAAIMLIGTLPFAASAAECSKTYGCTAPEGQHKEFCPMIPCGVGGPDGECDHGGWDHSADCSRASEGCSNNENCQADGVRGIHTDTCPKNPNNVTPEPQPEPLDPTDTNNCTLKEDCPVVVPYHKEGCLAVAKSDVAIDDGKKCTNSYDCPHRGNLHVAGCPMIPCSSDASCDHGGWNHTPDCPFACRNSDACHADYHLDTCPKNKVEEPNEPENDTNSNGNGNGTGNNVNDYFGDEALSPVWLYIYTNDNLNHPTKMINITNYTITDDTITKKEVMTVIDDYYKASNSNNGIIWKGMYMEHDDSNTSSLDIYQWVYGNIGDAVYNVNKARTEGTVIIMARVTGVTTVSSAAADNSNPKTGDQIFAPVAIMAVSACALAAVAFYLNKKRAM